MSKLELELKPEIDSNLDGNGTEGNSSYPSLKHEILRYTRSDIDHIKVHCNAKLLALKNGSSKYHLALLIRYTGLLAIIIPFNFLSLTFFFYLKPLYPFFNVILLCYIILFPVSIFSGVYFYNNVIRRRKDERKLYFPKFAQKRTISVDKWNLQISRKDSLRIRVVWYSCILLLFSYLYTQFLYSSNPTNAIAFFSYLIALEVIYCELFLIKHVVQRNISTNSRQIFALVSILGAFIGCMLLFLTQHLSVVLFLLPTFLLVSSLVYKYDLLEIYGKLILISKRLIFQLVEKLGLIRLKEQIKVPRDNSLIRIPAYINLSYLVDKSRLIEGFGKLLLVCKIASKRFIKIGSKLKNSKFIRIILHYTSLLVLLIPFNFIFFSLFFYYVSFNYILVGYILGYISFSTVLIFTGAYLLENCGKLKLIKCGAIESCMFLILYLILIDIISAILFIIPTFVVLSFISYKYNILAKCGNRIKNHLSNFIKKIKGFKYWRQITTSGIAGGCVLLLLYMIIQKSFFTTHLSIISNLLGGAIVSFLGLTGLLFSTSFLRLKYSKASLSIKKKEIYSKKSMNVEKNHSYFLKTLPILCFILGLLSNLFLFSFNGLNFPREMRTLLLFIPYLFYFLFIALIMERKTLGGNSKRTYLITLLLILPISLIIFSLATPGQLAYRIVPILSIYIAVGSILLIRKLNKSYFKREHTLVEKLKNIKVKTRKKILLLIFVVLIFLLISYNNIVTDQVLITFNIFGGGVICFIILIGYFIKTAASRTDYSTLYPLYLVALSIVTIIYSYLFFFLPQYLFYGAILTVGVILFFTHGKRNKNGTSNSRHTRSVSFISIFLVFMPLLLAVPSITITNPPNYEFAQVPNSERIEHSVQYENLEFYPSLNSIDWLTINDGLLLKTSLSPSFGVASRIKIQISPLNISPVDGYSIQTHEVSSKYINGPRRDFDLYVFVPLDEYNLLPGTYELEVYYSEFSGFGYRTSNPETYQIELEKDNLRIIPTNPFSEPLDMGFEYGAVYTFEYDLNGTLFWRTVFDGKVANSLNEGVQIVNLSLYIEDNDRYQWIANISTDNEGYFYYIHNISGWMEQNALAKIEWRGNEQYNQLRHEEYMGLEKDIHGRRFFYDENGDLYPDWPYTLADLLNALTSSASQSEPSQALAFMAEFPEGTGTSTFDMINNLEGILESNTTWTEGKRDYAISYDGDGIFTPPTPKGFVKSVEHIDLILTEMSNSYQLTKFQNIDNCIPFVTMKQDVGDDWDNIPCDIFFREIDGNPTIQAVRAGSSNSITLSIYVVEFDGTRVNVQSGTFSSSGTISDETINEVDLSKAVPLSYWKITGNDDDWDCAMVTTDFLDSDTVRMERDQATGTITGHYYVFEAQNSEFSVQKVEMSIASSETYDASSITEVNMSKTFVIGSWEVNEANDDPEDGALDIYLSSSTQVRADRHDSGVYDIPTINVFVVTFDESGSEFVERGEFVWANADTSKQQDLSKQFDQSASMVKSGSMYGIMECDGTASADVKSVFIEYEFIDSDTVGAERYANSEDGSGHWEVIEWKLLSDGSAIYEDFDYVNFGDILDSDLGSEFVLTTWVYPTQFQSNQSENGIKNVFLSKAGVIELGVNESGFLEVYLNTDNIEESATYGYPYSISLNTWSYIAIRYNNSNVDSLIGDTWCTTAQGGVDEPWDGGGSLKDGGDFTIGAEISTYSCFTGKIDDVSVFNISISNAEIESHSGGPVLEIDSIISTEDGQGGWSPITTSGETIEGYLNFQLNSTGKPIEIAEFYLSTTQPDLQDPTPNEWYLLASYNYDSHLYSYVSDSLDLPDNDTYYFICYAEDDIGNSVYDSYSEYFVIEHFDELINFTYIDKEGKINHISQIGVIPLDGCEWYVALLDVFINYSNDIDYLTTVTYSDLTSNYWLIFLDSLLSWSNGKGLSDGEYPINFIVQANLTYGSIFPNYYVNYTLNNTILDINGPNMALLSGSPYTLNLGATYDIVEDNTLTFAIESTDSDFSYVELYYKYNTPGSADWILYGNFPADNNSVADITFDIINLRDNNITFRIIGYDTLQNSKLLYESNYWFVKNFNNHLEFIVEGLDNSILYGLDQDDMIDLDLKIIPFDNDISEVIITTNYESFALDNPLAEQDHIYFEDDGTLDPDIRLNSTFYNIFGSDFATIPVEVRLYESNTLISYKEVVITVITSTFTDAIQISNLTIDISEDTNNIWMNFVNQSNAYNNSHGIPFISDNKPPVLKTYNSFGDLVQVVYLFAFLDDIDSETYNTTEIEINDNRFTVPLPTPQSGELCSIEEIIVNGSSYLFSYFVDMQDNELLITILSDTSLDGIFGTTNSPIEIEYGISTSLRTKDHFVGSCNFTLLNQDNYTFAGEFFDLSGNCSRFEITQPITIDYQGPVIFRQFKDNFVVNPEVGTISFILSDFSGVSDYWFNTIIEGYWTVYNDIYTFHFNDTSILEGSIYITLYCNDTLGYVSELEFSLVLDKTAPVFADVDINQTYGNDLFAINATITESSDYSISLEIVHISSGAIVTNFEYSIVEITDDEWQILIDTITLSNGYYNITIIAVDHAGNSDEYTIPDLYFDNAYSIVDSFVESIYVDGENIYNTTITDILYFNDEEYLTVSAYDTLFDGFDWSSIDPTIAEQLGIDDISMLYTNPLDWYGLNTSGSLDYETLIYELKEYIYLNHYAGTYSFRNDIDYPEGWTVDETGGTVNVISDLGGHNKVLELYDTSGATVAARTSFPGQTTGTIEWWWRASNNDDQVQMLIYDDFPFGSINILASYDHANWIQYYDTSTHDIKTYTANTWYHFRIEWDCADDWHLWIDGVSMDGGTGYDYNGDPVAMDNVRILTQTGDSGYYTYLDAVGYSWDPNYNIGDNLEFETNNNIQNIKSIQNLKIGNYTIDKFTVLLDGTSILLQIDEQYRYALSPLLTDDVYAQFYELTSDEIQLSFNTNTEVWDLISDGKNYFNISEYLELSEGDQFLHWFEITDGFGNELLSHKYTAFYDNIIEKLDDYILFNWHLGTNSTGAGIILFGSENYEDSTIQIDISSIAHNFNGEEDVSRIHIYGSENETDWEFVGRAYYSEEGLWCYYWDGDLLESLNELPPENYFLKAFIFDKAGNYLHGHFQATYSFTDEKDGTSGIDIGFVNSTTLGTCIIDSELDGHKNILHLYDTSDWQSMYHYFSSAQESGTIEFWARLGETNQYHRFILYDGATVFTYIMWGNGGFLQYHDGAWHNIVAYTADIWYHIRVDFECGAGGYQGLAADRIYIYVDGTRYGPYATTNAVDNLDRFYSDSKVRATMYFDAFGFSWDSEYTIGDNKYGYGYSTVKTYDYTQIELLTDLVFGEIFEYNHTAASNIQNIEGVIENYLQGSSTNLWDVIAEFYNINEREWVPLMTDSASIQTDGSYSITWDINTDEGFLASMYNFSYSYLPMSVTSATSSDLWGSWGIFNSTDVWQPIIISESGSNLDISVYAFDNTTGWELDSSLSTEITIPSLSDQVFKLFDIHRDGKWEILRITPSQIDVIYLDQNYEWSIKTNATGLSGYQYFHFDIAYDGSSSNTLMVVTQLDISEDLSLWLYGFDSDYTLIKYKERGSPANFIPISIRIINDFSTNNRRAVLVGGLMEGAYYSQLIEYDINLDVQNIIIDSILGKISIIEYDQLEGINSILLGIERIAIGKMDAVVVLRRKTWTEEWVEFELSNFDEVKFEVLDLLTIHENNIRSLIIASKSGLFETKISYNIDPNTITSPICFTTVSYSKQELTEIAQAEGKPGYYADILPQNVPIYEVYTILYRSSSTGQWYELSSEKYRNSRNEIQLDLLSVWGLLSHIKISYSFQSFIAEQRTTVDPSFEKYSGASSTQSVSASSTIFEDSSLPLLWLNPGTSSYMDPNWLSLPNAMSYQSRPVISGLGTTVAYPTVTTGWDNSWGTEYTAMPELENSIIYHDGSYNSGILSENLNGQDSYLGESAFDGRFEGNYVDGVWISNPYTSETYNFTQMYYPEIHDLDEDGGIYNYYDPDGDGVGLPETHYVLVRNRLTNVQDFNENNPQIFLEGVLPSPPNTPANSNPTIEESEIALLEPEWDEYLTTMGTSGDFGLDFAFKLPTVSRVNLDSIHIAFDATIYSTSFGNGDLPLSLQIYNNYLGRWESLPMASLAGTDPDETYASGALDYRFWSWEPDGEWTSPTTNEFRPKWSSTSMSNINTISYGETFPCTINSGDGSINYDSEVASGGNFFNNDLTGYEVNDLFITLGDNKALFYHDTDYHATKYQLNNLIIDPDNFYTYYNQNDPFPNYNSVEEFSRVGVDTFYQDFLNDNNELSIRILTTREVGQTTDPYLCVGNFNTFTFTNTNYLNYEEFESNAVDGHHVSQDIDFTDSGIGLYGYSGFNLREQPRSVKFRDTFSETSWALGYETNSTISYSQNVADNAVARSLYPNTHYDGPPLENFRSSWHDTWCEVVSADIITGSHYSGDKDDMDYNDGVYYQISPGWTSGLYRTKAKYYFIMIGKDCDFHYDIVLGSLDTDMCIYLGDSSSPRELLLHVYGDISPSGVIRIDDPDPTYDYIWIETASYGSNIIKMDYLEVNHLVQEDESFISIPVIPYYGSNPSDTWEFQASKIYQYAPNPTLDIYSTTDFDSSITWNNRPATISLISSNPFSTVPSTFTLDLGTIQTEQNSYFKIDLGNIYSNGLDYNNPIINYIIAKKYQEGGMLYMQTDEVGGEELTLVSPDYGDLLEMTPNDQLVVEFKAKTNNQINLELWKQGEPNPEHTFEVVPNGNNDFTKQIILLEHDQTLEFDQLKFTGTLDSEESFLVNAITVLEGAAIVDTKLSEYKFTIQEGIIDDPKPYCIFGEYETGSTPYHAQVEDDQDFTINSQFISENDKRVYMQFEFVVDKSELLDTKSTAIRLIGSGAGVSLEGDYYKLKNLNTGQYPDIPTK